MDGKNLKHRPVIEIKKGKDISQEPEMKELVRLFDNMTDHEKDRTFDHLRKSRRKQEGPGVSAEGGKIGGKSDSMTRYINPSSVQKNKKAGCSNERT